MPIPVLTPEALIKACQAQRRPYHDNYLVMYSSLWDGFVTDPTLWSVPADDHMVHRGDGVFEVFKCVEGRIYSFEAHLDRLRHSAGVIGLNLPEEFSRVRDICRELLHAGGEKNAQLRLTVSRGPGGFTSNPYEPPRSLMFLTSARLHLPPEEKYQKGVSMVTAPVEAKSGFMANIKSCAYLQNVLVKKAAVEAGADYAVSFDREGNLTEGSTENMAVVTRAGELVIPPWARILKGTTLLRIEDMAAGLISGGLLTALVHRDLKEAEAKAEAREIFVSSTTMDIMPVVSWDGRPVGDGRPGPVVRELRRLIRAEIAADGPHTTPMWP